MGFAKKILEKKPNPEKNLHTGESAGAELFYTQLAILTGPLRSFKISLFNAIVYQIIENLLHLRCNLQHEVIVSLLVRDFLDQKDLRENPHIPIPFLDFL